MLQMIIQVVILALYLLLMLLIGFGFYNTNNSLNDYFLGDRGLKDVYKRQIYVLIKKLLRQRSYLIERRIIMKKSLCAALLLSMTLALAGCAGQADTTAETETTEDSTAAETTERCV